MGPVAPQRVRGGDSAFVHIEDVQDLVEEELGRHSYVHFVRRRGCPCGLAACDQSIASTLYVCGLVSHQREELRRGMLTFASAEEPSYTVNEGWQAALVLLAGDGGGNERALRVHGEERLVRCGISLRRGGETRDENRRAGVRKPAAARRASVETHPGRRCGGGTGDVLPGRRHEPGPERVGGGAEHGRAHESGRLWANGRTRLCSDFPRW